MKINSDNEREAIEELPEHVRLRVVSELNMILKSFKTATVALMQSENTVEEYDELVTILGKSLLRMNRIGEAAVVRALLVRLIEYVKKGDILSLQKAEFMLASYLIHGKKEFEEFSSVRVSVISSSLLGSV